ncbi:hypothetical protein [Azohydromonas lata]|uniref:hypothetical protein n=1 Tax=Azohydromonas lata TaxID=45677 RepID=UPI00082D8EB4|nr:hypothetical protein [Azohydromonas lata]
MTHFERFCQDAYRMAGLAPYDIARRSQSAPAKDTCSEIVKLMQAAFETQQRSSGMPIEFFNTFEVSAPTCPHCAHEISLGEVLALKREGGADLFALARNEGIAEIACSSPSCGKTYWLKGGYLPHYTSAMTEDEL